MLCTVIQAAAPLPQALGGYHKTLYMCTHQFLPWQAWTQNLRVGDGASLKRENLFKMRTFPVWDWGKGVGHPSNVKCEDLRVQTCQSFQIYGFTDSFGVGLSDNYLADLAEYSENSVARKVRLYSKLPTIIHYVWVWLTLLYFFTILSQVQ